MPFRRSDRPRRISRDFHRPRTGNPLFPRAGSRRDSRRFGAGSARFVMVMLGIGAAFLAWYLIWGNAFRITDIQVSGISAPAEEAIRAGLTSHTDRALLGLLPRSNVLFFSSDKAMESIALNVALDRIEIRKRLPHTVIVTAGEKVARAALDRSGRLFALDEAGTIIRELSADETDRLGVLPPGMDAIPVQGLGAEVVDLPATTGATAPEPSADDQASGGTVSLIRTDDTAPTGSGTAGTAPGTAAVPAAAMRLILQAQTRLPDIVGEDLLWFTVQPASETVEAVVASGWKVLMSSALPFDAQGDRLGIVLKEKIGSKRDKLEYIDLRYNERIFFRYNDGTGQ